MLFLKKDRQNEAGSAVRKIWQPAGPIRWLSSRRAQAGLPLLETTDVPVHETSTVVEFQPTVTQLRHVNDARRTSPSAYRHTFRL